ncbi:glycosyl hydrolase family 18 (putative chitinase) [Blastococcus colisei]|uniref:Glycosyl hydrolase family 18 (Putative chitinase) n=1 Tax=Blastococcus colisei TaxID=1564162 RepID=A0A543P1C0_9ACTN|nr:glycosyl hydrolase family 18 protein [Blastococcus colisei]TQN37915.1 glycosyl hydrolase family 18 (putative chitinase) [Blastococcus colisei]
MSRRRWIYGSAVVVVAVLAVAAALTLPGKLADRDRPLVAAAWLPVWDERAAESLRPALDVGGVTEVSPTWATVGLDGELVVTPPTAEVLDRLEAAGARLLPTVQNFADGSWQGELVAELLRDPARELAHREALVDLALANDWDGIDIDYEALPPTAGPQFIDFLTALGADLDEHGLDLTVAVPARSADEDPGTLAYSYQLLGRVADQVRVMTYDHSWSTSDAGPVAPLDWVSSVIDYAVERVPADKLMLGLPTYGYDWVGTRGEVIGAAEAAALAAEVGAEPAWYEGAASRTFSYVRDGEQHTVWYEDARSLQAAQDLAVEAGLRGVAIWQLGGEDPDVWPALAAVTGGGNPS